MAKSKRPIGGLIFLVSLLFLLVLGGMNTIVLLGMIDSEAMQRLILFILGGSIGAWLASKLIRNELSVMLHEYKHAIVSNLTGNKWKGMKVEEGTGHFEYAYTKDTRAYNAFISLAPYYLPLFTIPGFLIGIPLLNVHPNAYLLFVGCCYGIDSLLNYRDIAPYQTDFSNLLGGYRTGILYVIGMNLTLGTTLLAWVFHDLNGLQELGTGLFHLFAYLLPVKLPA